MLKKKNAAMIPVWLFILLAAVIAALPLFFTVTGSFMTEQEQQSRYGAEIIDANTSDFK